MEQRMDLGSLLAAAGAAVVLVSLFLDWYEPGRSAWTMFELLDLALAALALATLAAAIPLYRMSGQAARLLSPRWLPALGLVALAIVIVSLVNHPPAARGVGKEEGAWIALAGTALMAAGGILSQANISLVVSRRQPDPASTPSVETSVRPTEPVTTDEPASSAPAEAPATTAAPDEPPPPGEPPAGPRG